MTPSRIKRHLTAAVIALETAAAAIFPVNGSVRVILVIDGSSSMCINPPDSSGCCTAGDGTGNCMLNDTGDIRIQAAQMFVDSLAARNPVAQIGVITFNRSTIQLNPRILSAANLELIKNRLSDASCDSILSLPRTGFSGDTTNSAPASLGKTLRSNATYLGLALRTGLTLADMDSIALPAGSPRHIIIVTDGGWDNTGTQTPDNMIDNYRDLYPERTVPIVHCIFMSNSELHQMHGYPPEGCAMAEGIDFTKLERITQLTGGRYFPAPTPQTIIQTMKTLFDTIAASALASAKRPAGHFNSITKCSLSDKTFSCFNLLGKNVGSVPIGNPARGTLPDGIYFIIDKRTRTVRTDILIK